MFANLKSHLQMNVWYGRGGAGDIVTLSFLRQNILYSIKNIGLLKKWIKFVYFLKCQDIQKDKKRRIIDLNPSK